MKLLTVAVSLLVFLISPMVQADEKAIQLMNEAANDLNEAASKTGQGKEKEVDDLVFQAVEKAAEARKRVKESGIGLEHNSGRYVGYGDRDGDGLHDPDHPDNLREKTQNPVSSLISVPLESNFNFSVGEAENFQYVMNAKPVIPMKINDKWNWIHRGIQPIVAQDNLTNSGQGLETDDTIFGLADFTYQGFLTSAKPSKVITGYGVVGVVPWGEDGVSSEKWQVGPGFVALTKINKFVLGSVVTQQWDFAGKGKAEDVSLAVWQYFINYNMSKGWFLLSTPTMSANWEAEKSGDKLTIPIGGGVGRLFKIGGHPFRASVQAFGYPATPDAVDTDYTIQAEFRLLFPK